MPGDQAPAKPCHRKTLADSARSPISAQRVGKPRQQEPNVTEVTHSAGSQGPGVQGCMLSPEHQATQPRLWTGTEEEQTYPGFASAAEPRERPSAFHPQVLTVVPSLQEKLRLPRSLLGVSGPGQESGSRGFQLPAECLEQQTSKPWQAEGEGKMRSILIGLLDDTEVVLSFHHFLRLTHSRCMARHKIITSKMHKVYHSVFGRAGQLVVCMELIFRRLYFHY